MEETSHGNSNKKIFEDLGDQGKNFVEESEEFAGEDVVVRKDKLIDRFICR